MKKKIFKYCTLNEYTLENIKENQLYFNLAKYLNDPFEGAFDFEINSNQVYNFLRFFYQHKYTELMSSNEKLITIIEHTRRTIITQFLNEMRLSCFSSKNDSLLMWGHYADKHNGICIAYNTHDPIFSSMEQVTYTDRMPKIKIENEEDYLEKNLIKQFIKAISNKHKGWEYEDEYRIFDITGTGKFKLINNSIESVYFGLFCSSKNEKKIRNLLIKQNVNYFRMRINTKEYKLGFYKV